MDKPKKIHWDAVIIVIKYLKASPGKELLFKKSTSLAIHACSDVENLKT